MLRTTHTSSVTEDQIDHLGHMNVRFYAVNAQAGTQALLASLPGSEGLRFEVRDVYTRHYREQLLGTALVVRSAVLSADADRLRLHHELAPAEGEELAATFVHGIRAVDGHGRPQRLPDELVAAAAHDVIDAPPYATSRSIALDADLEATAPSLELVRERGLEMRRERVVTPDECDEHGRYRPELAPMLTWGGEAVPGEAMAPLHALADGRQMGWATMETRLQTSGLPTVGTRIQAFGAGVAVHDKVMHRLQWAYDLETGALLAAFALVGLAFDIAARAAMSIPEGMRARLLEDLQPDLAPQAARSADA